MATYTELLQAIENETLLKKIRVACVVAAELIRVESVNTANHTNRLLWAKGVFGDLESTARKMLWAVLAQNRAAALSAITGADDATVQTAVNNAVDLFAGV